jgi:hypothetical protein
MQLTYFTDYSLRVLISLERLCTISEIAEAYASRTST